MFKQPTEDECLNAIGLYKERTWDGSIRYAVRNFTSAVATPDLIRAIQPDSSTFVPIPKPGPNDWLANHKETGQTFEKFLSSNPPVPDARQRSTIHILPLTFFESAVPPDVSQLLAQFASIFFSVPVKILEAESLGQYVQHRTNSYTGRVQVHAGQILERMMAVLPADSFCMGAITMCDLYPLDSWNFVFGLANMKGRVGVYSLARYMPGFNNGTVTLTADMSSAEKSALLKRSCLLMCHEMCHMFGLHHCIYFHCLMNGSNNFEENDQKPLRLCPACLRKLHNSCRFDVADRYRQLAYFCQASGMAAESEWFGKRFSLLSDG